MDPSLRHFIKSYEVSTGRRIIATRKVREIALRRGDTHIAAQADKALRHDHETRKLDLEWLGRKHGARRSGALAALDNRVDHALGGIRDGARSLTRGALDGDELAAKAKSFLDELLPGGLYSVTSLSFAEGLAAVETLAEKLQGPLAQLVAELNLSLQVQRFLELVDEYRAAHHTHAPRHIEFSEVRRARERGQRYWLELIALILGTYFDGDDPDHVAARTELLAPIAEQNAAIRKSMRARRTAPDVNPDTGELESGPAGHVPAPDQVASSSSDTGASISA